MRKGAIILAVEDDPNDRLFIEHAFRKAGVTGPIHMVEDGEVAIAYLRGDGRFADREKYPYPTFILTDLKMPKINGFQLLEFLKRNPSWAVIPTIVLSASSDPDDIKKSYLLGASSYHVKPQSLDELVARLGLLHSYWISCEVPETEASGKQRSTEGSGKMGAEIPQPGGGEKPS